MKRKILFFNILAFCLVISFSCKNNVDAKKGEDEGEDAEEIELRLKGDRYVEIDDDVITIKKETKWQEIKDEINQRLSFDEGYALNRWHVGSSRGKILSENYVFKKNAAIYATSKKEQQEKKEKQAKHKKERAKKGKNKPVLLRLKASENVILQYAALEVPKGTMWQDLRETEYICGTEAKNGYYLSEWKLENNEEGASIEDEHIFEKNESLYIFALKDEEDWQEDEYIGNYRPAIPQEEEIADGELIDIEPPLEKIISPPIDYPLPAFPKPLKAQLWQGVFSTENATKLSPFRLGKYELTYRLWKDVYIWACKNGYKFANEGSCGSGNKGAGRQPVVMVSWCDAIVWCNAYTEKMGMRDACVYLKKSDGLCIKDVEDAKVPSNMLIDVAKKGFRLPLEEEWEYAARRESDAAPNTVDVAGAIFNKLNATSGAALPIACKNCEGRAFNAMNAQLVGTTVCKWYFNGAVYKEVEPKVSGTMPCASKRANYLGLYDMSGNVEELCAILTKDAVFGAKIESGFFCVARGGSWNSFSYDCAVGRRRCREIGEHSTSLGFRICQTK